MDETSWQKQLLIGVVMLLVVGGLIGVVVAVAGLKAADLAGIGETKHTTSSGQRLHIPRNVGTHRSGASCAHPASSTSTGAARHHRHAHRAFSLTASPKTARSLQKINLTGTYKAHDGTTLQVQRRQDGGLGRLPDDRTRRRRQLATFIETTHLGANHLRMTDKASGRSSNVATVVGALTPALSECAQRMARRPPGRAPAGARTRSRSTGPSPSPPCGRAAASRRTSSRSSSR